MDTTNEDTSTGKGGETGKNLICCPLCCYPYSTRKTRTPRILECGHTTCHACLQKMIQESVIECPFCRDLTPVMCNKVENLKKNFALLDIDSVGEATHEAEDAKIALFELEYDRDKAGRGNQSSRDCFSMSCTPRTDQQSRAIQALGLTILTGNLCLDWIVNDHVSKIAAMLEHGKLWNSSVHIPSLQKYHDIGTDWNAVRIIFLEFAIFTTICFTLQFCGTMIRLRFFTNRSPFQKFLVLMGLFLNDLPQCIATAIVTFAIDDVYIPYFCSTTLGVIGNYIMFIALSETAAFHFPKVIWFHVALTVICLVVQIALITKAHLT